MLHLNPRKRGSQEEQLLSLAARMQSTAVPLTYVFSAPPPGWYEEQLRERGVRVRWLDFRRPMRAAASLFRSLRAERPVVVHFHFFRAASPIVLAGIASGARIIVNDHVSLTPGNRGRLASIAKRLRNRIVNPRIDLRLAVSSYVAATVSRYEDVDPRRLVVVDNGIPIGRFENARPDGVREELGVQNRPLVVCVARLAREKGVETAVRMVPRLGHGAVLALVGDGPLASNLKRLARDLALSDRVRFLGLRNDVDRILAAADVSIVPSEWEEAFGQAVVESMAARKPVVVTESGAMPGIVGQCGLVVPKGDPVALADAVNRLLEDHTTARAMGDAAHRRAQELFSLGPWTDRMCGLYERLLRLRPSATKSTPR